MALAIRAKQELQVEKERYFVQVQQRCAFFSACATGALKIVKKCIKTDPDYIGLGNEEGLSALGVAIIHGQATVLDYFILMEYQTTIKVLKGQPELLFFAIDHDLISFVEMATFHDPSLLDYKNGLGENLFFYACKKLDLRLMKHFYTLSPKSIKIKNSLEQTPFSFLALSKDAGSTHFTWLIQKTRYQVSSSEEAKAFVEHLKTNLFFDEGLILKVVKFETLPYFLAYIRDFDRVVDSERVMNYLQDLLEPYPADFHYEGPQEELLEGDGLIEFCNAHIPDEPTITNPFKQLYRLFFSIKRVEYVAQMSFGDLKAKNKDVKTQKSQDLKECRELFKKVKHEIPRKKQYLIKILKHLTCYLKSEHGSKEKLIFLKDLTAAAPHCYTHYSTILRSIYSRISSNDAFSSVQRRADDETSSFEECLRVFLKKAFCHKLRQIHGSMNVHCHFVAQKFLKEENYPLPEDPIMDEQVHLIPSLLLFRQEKLGIIFEEEDQEIVESEQLLFEDTKQRYFSLLSNQLINTGFIYEQTLNLLVESLAGEHSEVFLSQLTSWLERNKISAHSILRFNEQGNYLIKKTGVLEILSHLPQKIVL